ncbi:hypothetical protein L6R53_00690 [Myxococcota bacterium]|nr:hypothetical protein [Myxococcota bacterium]
MTTFRPPQATCTVRVFKAGLLSAMGHDLELRLTRFSLTVDGDRIQGDFDATSLEVVGAIKDGRLDPGALSAKDQRDILDNVRKAVFKGLRPEAVRFEAQGVEQTDEGLAGTGTLTIPPRRHDLDFEVHRAGGKATCEVVLHQPDWGISPFKAPLGVLKIQPDLRVRVEVPWA